MQFRVLGVLEVLDHEGRTVDLGGAHQRTVLGRLLAAAGRPVPVASIIDDLWGEAPPPSAAGSLQSYVSRLRRALERAGGAGTLVRDGGGYRLAVVDDDVDFRRFERLAEAGRDELAAGDAAAASATLTEALALWRGPALGEWVDMEWAVGIATRLDERRLVAVEDRARADLELGRHDAVVVELGELVGAHPYREGLAVSLATALYRCGRQADALRAINDLRDRLRDGLGLDPGPRVGELEVRILNHDPVLLPPPVAAVEPSPPPAVPNVRHVGGLEANRIVGRDAEVAALDDALRTALSGRMTWVVLEGTAGIGKSRLAEHVADHAATEGADVMWARSPEGGATPALWPWLGVLRWLAVSTAPLADAGLAQLIERLLDPAAADDAGAIVAPNDPRRLRTFEAVSLLVEHASRAQPRLLILDDVHWADPASLELMAYLAGCAFSVPLLVVVTARPFDGGEPVAHALSRIARRPHTRRLVLRGVGAGDCAELIQQATGHRPSAEVAAAVFARAEGNPFFIRELGRLLETDAEGLDGIRADADLVQRAGVPAGVRDVLRQRVKRLEPRTLDLLQTAAALGREVSLPLLARAARLGIDDCAEGLDPAIAAGLLTEVRGGVAMVRFEHALVQEVLLDDMSMVARARVHLRAADAIEDTRGATADDAEMVAAHLWQAAAVVPGDRVPRALERAADVAVRRMALETAADLLERSLQLREAMPAGDVDAMAELETMRRATALRRAVSGYARAGERIARAKELARRSGSYDVLAELIWTEWAGMATVGVPSEARRLAGELATVAAAADDAALTAVSLSASGVTELSFGDLALGCRDLDRALASRGSDGQVDGHRTSGAARGWLLESDIIAVCFQALAHQLAGVADPALASLRPLAEASTEPYARLVLWVFEGMRACLASDLDAAWLAGKHAVEEATEGGFEFYLAGGRVVLGEVLIRSGSPAEGIASIERGLEAYARAGTRTFVPWFAARAALGSLDLGDVDGARRWVERARQTLAQSGEHWQTPAIDIARARVDAASGAISADGAADRIAAALEHARAAGAHGLVARLRADV